MRVRCWPSLVLGTLLIDCAQAFVPACFVKVSPSSQALIVKNSPCQRDRIASSAAIACPSSSRSQRARDRLRPLFAVENKVRADEVLDVAFMGATEEVLDVAIVGAGPAGLALAIGLKQKGLHVKVFEAVPEIKERGAAVFLQASSKSSGHVPI